MCLPRVLRVTDPSAISWGPRRGVSLDDFGFDRAVQRRVAPPGHGMSVELDGLGTEGGDRRDPGGVGEAVGAPSTGVAGAVLVGGGEVAGPAVEPGVAARCWTLDANSRTAVSPAMPSTAPRYAERTGTAVRPRPGSSAMRRPLVAVGPDPARPRTRRSSTGARAPASISSDDRRVLRDAATTATNR